MTRRVTVGSLLLAAWAGAAAPDAHAQVLGTFPWQMQPYCNVITLTLTSSPAGFALDGSDDQCGAANRASAVGVATFNAGGDVTLNFSVVTAPSGRPVHVSAVVSPASGSGTWTDSVGNAGTFAFFGATAGLPSRPLPASGLPAATVTATELAGNAVTGAKVADGSLTSVDLLDAPRGAFATGTSAPQLPTSATVVQTVSVPVPAPGRVLVHASGTFYFSSSSATLQSVRCSITTGTTIDTTNLIQADDAASTLFVAEPFGAVRGFNASAGSFTANLVCQELTGDVLLGAANMTAVFVAQ